jgi:hypothetical protein
MKLCIIGSSSSVSARVVEIVNARNDVQVVTVGRDSDCDINLDLNFDNFSLDQFDIPLDCDKYLITLGLLYSKKINNQSSVEILNSMVVNLLFPVKLVESILNVNPNANIVILGSESGSKGSFDTSYFLAKAALSKYIKEKRISYPEQQLVMIAPSVIIDTKMTQDRGDLKAVLSKCKELPKKRCLYVQEVAELIMYILFVDTGYINNEVINMNGGKFSRMFYDNNG